MKVFLLKGDLSILYILGLFVIMSFILV